MNKPVSRRLEDDCETNVCGDGRASRMIQIILLLLGLISGIFPTLAAQVEQVWSAQQSGHQGGLLTTDEEGNVYVASYAQPSTSKWDIVLTKYSAGGTKLWESRYDGLKENDFPYAVAAKGTSVVVVGQTFSTNNTADILTLKFSTNGALQWVARYNGPANRSEAATAAALDDAGNVVVAGTSAGLNDALDMLAIKYDASGNQLWVFRYDGPGQSREDLAGMKLDAQGNVYLAGFSGDVGDWAALATIKLSPDGQQLWAARFLSSSEWVEIYARGLALDGAGNVVTVGEEAGELVTIKYAPDGTHLWTARYRAEEPAWMIMAGVRVDGANNILAAGNLYGSATNDAVVVKYNAAGQQLWASRISDPNHAFHLNAIDVDPEGNTYLTGTPHNDALIAKVGSNGDQLWRIKYHSTGEVYDNGEFLEYDGLGNVIISGRSLFFGENFLSVVKFRQDNVAGTPLVTVSPTNLSEYPGTSVTFTAVATGAGPLQYQWRFTGRPIPDATNSSLTISNVQAANRGDYSVTVSNPFGVTTSPEARLSVLVKPTVTVQPGIEVAVAGSDVAFLATPEGTAPFTFQWRHNGTNIPGAKGSVLRLFDLKSPDAGSYSVVVVNAAGSVTSSVVSLTVSQSANQFEAIRYDGPVHGSDDNPLLHVTTDGEAIVAASVTGAGTGADIGVIKYSGSGTQLWASTYNRQGTVDDRPADLAVDGEGNIYITGFSGESDTSFRVFTTLKYNAGGQLLWARHFQETNSFYNYGTSIAIGPGGTVSVAGRANALAVVVRYDAAGNLLWTARGSNSWYDVMQSVAVDGSGNTYFGTSQFNSSASSDFVLRKLNPAGGEVWTRVFDTGEEDEFNSLTLDPADNVIVAGTSFGELSESWDTIVLKYAPDGTRLWATNVDNLPNQADFSRGLAINKTGEIFVVASLEGYDDEVLGTAIMKFASDGQLLWNAVEPLLQAASRTRIAIDKAGAVFVTGAESRVMTGYDIATVKYDSGGARVWLAHAGGPGASYDFGTAAALNNQGTVYVAGYGASSIGIGNDVLLLRYSDVATDALHRVAAYRTTNGLFRLAAPADTNFAVEVSADMLHWSRVEDAEELQQLLHSGVPIPASATTRFYRLVFLED